MKLNEPEVVVRCRAVDLAVVKKAAPRALAAYLQVPPPPPPRPTWDPPTPDAPTAPPPPPQLVKAEGRDAPCVVKVNEDAAKYLAPPPGAARAEEGTKSCAGGVVLTANAGRIVCDNTLNARLDIVVEDLLPRLRTALFPTYAEATKITRAQGLPTAPHHAAAH